jgi:non-canonical purine NTP pyrophosphatase (RdgB/HAM1 family)
MDLSSQRAAPPLPVSPNASPSYQTLDITEIATTNKGKLAEFSRLLGRSITGTKLAIPELQPEDRHYAGMRAGAYLEVVRDIAEGKARAAFQLNGNKPVLVEDSSLFLDCMEGLPGPLVKAFSSDEGLLRMCREAHDPADRGIPNPRAVAVVALAAWNGVDEKPQTWIGAIEGTVATKPRGQNGFGWDSIFIPNDQPEMVGWGCSEPRTFAEMTNDEKDSLSMRKLVVKELLNRPFLVPKAIES